MTVVTRFAPSPTGHLHIGHAFAACFAFDAARAAGGRFLLRIEDIDASRCRPEFEAGILTDLAWLGLRWEQPVRRQSDHFADYRTALARLDALGVLYPCFCTRADIQREIAASPAAPHGPDGPLYPGTCRSLGLEARARRMAAGEAYALRLDVGRALAQVQGPLAFHDDVHGTIPADPRQFGDVVLARKETPASYHLSVTVDDHLQGVTLVTRGEDLLPATHVHRLLQALLGYAVPAYRHHRLLLDENGQRFAKRNRSVTLQSLRESGVAAADIRRRVGL
jgi:glutamyl-Q tRNA(Asp) synthetase